MIQGLLTYDQVVARDPEAFKRISKRAKLDEMREDWLKQRRGRVTASQAYKLFTKALVPTNSKTSRGYIYERIAEAMGAEVPGFSSQATQWGHDQEPHAVMAYMERTGNKVVRWGDGVEHGDGQQFITFSRRLGATPDGIVPDAKKTLQIKSPYNPGIHLMHCRMKGAEDMRLITPEYYVQVQFEMRAVREGLGLEIEGCDFVSFDPRTSDHLKLKIIEVPYDEAFQDTLGSVLTKAEDEIEQACKELSQK